MAVDPLLRDLAARWIEGVTARREWALGAAALLLAVSAVRALRPRARVPAAVGAATLLVAVGAGLLWGWELRWIADDAFFSFRYASNLVAGHGLVFEPGERVEGYTNFLWTMLVAAAMALGAEPVLASVVLSLASFAAVIVLTARHARALDGGGPSLVPLAALATATNYVMATYATSGLETMLAAALVLGAVAAAERHRVGLSGLLGVLAAMAHPDHGLYYATLGVVLLLDRARRARILRYVAPFLVIFLPWFAWRWAYYGDPLPNTYHAKSADLAYFAQGRAYVTICIFGAGVFALGVPAIAGAWHCRRSVLARWTLLTAPLFLLYVAKIGGDFMLGRLIVTLIPPVLVLAEVGTLRTLRASRAWLRPAGVALGACTLVAAIPVTVLRSGEKYWHVADERTFYRLTSVRPVVVDSGYFEAARRLAEHFTARGLRPKLFIDSAGFIAHYTRLPIVDTFGLTDRRIARHPLAGRGRPGHEKSSSGADVLHRGGTLAWFPSYPAPYAAKTPFTVDGFQYWIGRYEPRWLDPLLAAPSVSFADPRQQLELWLLGAREVAVDRLDCDVWFWNTYFFDQAADDVRAARIAREVVVRHEHLRPVERWLFRDPARSDELREVRRWRFERGEAWESTGEAFVEFPASGAAPGQELGGGYEGGFASSFSPRAGDYAKGRLRGAPFVIEGDVLALRVGGGHGLDDRYVGLTVGGETVRRSTGCESEFLGVRVWSVSELRGREARIEIVDEAAGAWGHVAADEVVLYALR